MPDSDRRREGQWIRCYTLHSTDSFQFGGLVIVRSLFELFTEAALEPVRKLDRFVVKVRNKWAGIQVTGYDVKTQTSDLKLVLFS